MTSLWYSLVITATTLSGPIPSSSRSTAAINRVKPQLESQLKTRNLHWGSPLFIRIFKESNELEVWLQKGTAFSHFKTYPICYFSGKLGPKLQQGDGQSPEGFYFVTPTRMNPASTFHLSFNLGYPNHSERDLGRTGDFLMVHGDCVSIGCYAMTDAQIEEIYALASAALEHGQPYFRVHSFPFRMTSERMTKAAGSRWHAFWKNLKEGYDVFEKTLLPPDVRSSDQRYVFSSPK
jgi:murein L,D-transpeptidase YafK